MHTRNYFGVGADSGARAPGSPAILGCVDWKRLREALARARADEDLTLDELAEASGVDRSTIHRIENVKKMPDYNPDLDTIEAMVRGMHRTLSQFFADVERSRNASLTSGARSPQSEGSSGPGSPQHGDPLPPTSDDDPIATFARAIVEAAHRGSDRPRESAPSDRAPRPSRRAPARRRR